MKIQKRQEIEFFGTKTGNANSIALGYATETKNFGEVAVGVMNKSTAAKDPNSPKGVCVDSDATLFSVGCGGSGERKNALEVKGDGSVLISGEDGDINVADKIKQALDTDASIELVKSADSDLQYTLMVNNESRGSINIPKDQFLKNVTYDTDAKQLVFTFVTLDEEEHVERISINDLKDVYTAGDGINIDNNVISADFSSVMTAISDEKTQRETTDNEIKSTLDTKADKTSLPTKLSDLENDGVDITINKGESSRRPLIIKSKYGDVYRSALKYALHDENSTIAQLTFTSFDANGGLFSQVQVRPSDNNEQYIIQVQDVIGRKINRLSTMSVNGFWSVNYENNTYVSLGTNDLSFYTNVNSSADSAERLQLTVNKDGITKKDGKATEVFAADGTLFDLTTKADTSAIPTKTSQLTNDSSFATEDYVVDNISNFKYIAILNYNNTISGLFDENGKSMDAWFKNSKSIIIGFSDDTDLDNVHPYNTVSIGNNVSCKGDSNVYIGNEVEAGGNNNVLIGRNITYDGNNSVVIGSSNNNFIRNGYISIGYDVYPNMNTIYQIAGHGGNNQYNLEETLTYDNQHKKYIYGIGGYDGTNPDAEGVKSLQEVLADKADASSIPDVSTKADLVDGKLKADQLPKLDNIAAATTTEDMITKFNALLTDLKAKGYMTADITA